jgi:hypothetical protein
MKTIRRILLISTIVLLCLFVIAMNSKSDSSDLIAKTTEGTPPLLFCLSFDDNSDPDGVDWVVELLAGLKNPDGSSVHTSLMVNTMSLSVPAQSPGPAWLRAIKAGHELGNHTHDHNMGVDATTLSEEKWRETIKKGDQLLTAPVSKGGLGLKKVDGFRAPRGEVSDHITKIIGELGYAYDSSLPGAWSVEGSWPAKIAETEIWELPVSWLELPTEILPLGRRIVSALGFEQFGLGVDMSLFHPDEGNLSKEQALTILKANLDSRLKGERAPLIFVGHTQIMADAADAEMKWQTTAKDRREFYREFLEYAVSLPEVKVVSNIELVDWLNANGTP